MGAGAFGWLAFGWYTIPLEVDVEPPVELIGVGGSMSGSPLPGGSLDAMRPSGFVRAAKPGGSVIFKP